MENAVGPVGRVMTAARVARASGADEDVHAYWEVVLGAVKGEDGGGGFREGLALMESVDALEREVGCDLVGKAADAHESARDVAATALMALAATETRTSVLRALAVGLGWTQDPRAVPVLAGFARHEDVALRRAVADALGSTATGRPDGADVEALIRLTGDEDSDVRNWAAFSLGVQTNHDTAVIREALWACATDEDVEVRQEGARGLARRRVPGTVPLVARLLETDGGSQVFLLEAAEILGAPELLPALRARDQDTADVEEAIRACDPALRARIEEDAWSIVLELERLRPELGAALDSPRYESVHHLRVTIGETTEAVYDAAALLARADGDPSRAAELTLTDAAPRRETEPPGGSST